MDSPNPYASPQSAATEPTVSQQALGELVKSWEKFRLLYNAVLLLPGIGVLAICIIFAKLTLLLTIGFGLACGIAANLAFLAGPLAELYLRAIFFKSAPKPLLRKSILIGGFLLSFGIMAAVALFAWFSDSLTDELPAQASASAGHFTALQIH